MKKATHFMPGLGTTCKSSLSKLQNRVASVRGRSVLFLFQQNRFVLKALLLHHVFLQGFPEDIRRYSRASGIYSPFYFEL